MVYFTLIGNHDVIDKNQEGFGAALTIFFHYKDELDGVYIFTSPDKSNFPYKQMAEKTMGRMKLEKKDLPVSVIELDLENPVNFNLVYNVMLDETQKVIEKDSIQSDNKIINITSGTPTMATCWVLLQKSGLIPNAKLIQSFEPHFQRKYGTMCQVVDLEIDNFPEINTPSKEKRALYRAKEELKVLKNEKSTTQIDTSIPNLIGKTNSIRNIKEQILKLINTHTHVLILGEPGTGKEVIASAVWNQYRKEIDKDRVTFDCGLFEPNLIISELFGYEKGAFTGANKKKTGIIEQYNGRMIYLDEIGNIPLAKQSIFMRFLQFGEWRRVGGDRVNKSNIQIVAATNKDIYNPALFAPDLRDRFDEIIKIPPLRDRKDDIKLLVDNFLLKEEKNVSFGKSIYHEIKRYSWPGNIRQLKKWVQRICRFYNDAHLEWADLSDTLKPDQIESIDDGQIFPDFPIKYYSYVDQLRLRALETAGGNMSHADRLLGLKDGTIKQWRFQRKNRKQ